MADIPRVMMAVPIYESVKPLAYFSQMQLMQQMSIDEMRRRYKVRLSVIGPRTPIRVARNLFVEQVLSTGASHLFMLDDDIITLPDTLERLLTAEKPIIGAFIRNKDGDPCVFQDAPGGGEIPWRNAPDEGVHEVSAIGTGCILVEAEVFRSIDPPWFYFERSVPTMDVNFCRLVRSRGFKVYCDCGLGLGQIDHESGVIGYAGGPGKPSGNDQQRDGGVSPLSVRKLQETDQRPPEGFDRPPTMERPR